MSLKTKLVIAATVLALFVRDLDRMGLTSPAEIQERADAALVPPRIPESFRLRFQFHPRGGFRADVASEQAQTKSHRAGSSPSTGTHRSPVAVWEYDPAGG